jgi:opacity protein-like surface antigen
MKNTLKSLLACAAWACATVSTVFAADIDPAVQGKIDAKVKEIQTWAAEPVVVSAVKAHNDSLPTDSATMTQEKWKTLPILDPFVRGFSKNEAGQTLKAKKEDVVSEAFLSGADGLKVAFLTKPSNWSHKGKDKHEQPMAGKTWQGPVEVDDSTGLQQVQVAVPVMDGEKSIGSLVVGLSLSKLSQ